MNIIHSVKKILYNKFNLFFNPFLDKIIPSTFSNKDLFETLFQPQINKIFDGINITIFAYGQTSTGKTYTMKGEIPNNEGIIPLSVKEIFNFIESNNKILNTKIKVSYIEIYNECINDLLDSTKKNLDIRENNLRDVFVNNLTEISVSNYFEIMNLLIKGEENRIVAETKLNEKSSRSHSLFRLTIETNKLFNGKEITLLSKVNLIDLAGSENATKTQCVGLRLKEGININKSLLALSNVISKLSQPNQKLFVNYRDSKLTRLLQSSLSGNSKTSIICTITDDIEHYSETMNTIYFGLRAKNIKTIVRVNEVNQKNFMQIENQKLKSKLKELELELSTTRKVSDGKCFFGYNYINNTNFQGNNFKNGKSDLSVDYEDDDNEKKSKNAIKIIEKELNVLKNYFSKKNFRFVFNDDDNKSMISDFTEENICKQLFNESMMNTNNKINNNENDIKITSINSFTISCCNKNNNSLTTVIRNLQNDISNLKNYNLKLQNENDMLKSNLKTFMESYKENTSLKKENKQNNLMRTPFKETNMNESLQNTACVNNRHKKYLMRKRLYEN